MSSKIDQSDREAPATSQQGESARAPSRNGNGQPTPAPSPAGRGRDTDTPIRVLMITCEWRFAPFIRRQAEFLEAAGVDLDVVRFQGKRSPVNYFKAWIRVQGRLTAKRYDLVHAQFGQSGLLAWPKRVPLVVTFRGSDVHGIVEGEEGGQTFSGKLLRRVGRIAARRADAAIAVSEHLKRCIDRDRSSPAHVIPSGIDLELFRCLPRDEARTRLGLPLSKRFVLFVDNPAEPGKRYGLARQAVDLLNRSLRAELIVASHVPYSRMPAYMNACDALVFASIREGSPNVIKEALACNLPIVSVQVGDVEERLKGVEGCELCPDDRAETIAASLERVLRRGNRIEGRNAVKNLDEKLLTSKVIEIYQSVLQNRRR